MYHREPTEPFFTSSTGRFEVFKVDCYQHPNETLIIDRDAAQVVRRGDTIYYNSLEEESEMRVHIRENNMNSSYQVLPRKYYFEALADSNTTRSKGCALCGSASAALITRHFVKHHPTTIAGLQQPINYSELEASYLLKPVHVQVLWRFSSNPNDQRAKYVIMKGFTEQDAQVPSRAASTNPLLDRLASMHSSGANPAPTTREASDWMVREGWQEFMTAGKDVLLPVERLSSLNKNPRFDMLRREFQARVMGTEDKARSFNSPLLHKALTKFSGPVRTSSSRQTLEFTRLWYWILYKIPWETAQLIIDPPPPTVRQAMDDLKDKLEGVPRAQSFEELIRPIFVWLAWSPLPLLGRNGVKGHCLCPLIAAVIVYQYNFEHKYLNLDKARDFLLHICYIIGVLGIQEVLDRCEELEPDPGRLQVLIRESLVEQMQVQDRASITVAGYLQKQRGPASSFQQHLTGKQTVEHRPGTNILVLKHQTLDVAQLKGCLSDVIAVLQGEQWVKICPYDYKKCVEESPIHLYSEDLKIKDCPGRSFVDAYFRCSGLNWIGQQIRKYVTPGLNALGELDLSPAQAAVSLEANQGNFVRLSLDPDACQKALDEIHSWKRALFVVLFWTAGAPARVTEWCELLIFSTHQVARSIYISANLDNEPVVALEMCYSKRSHRQFFNKRTVRYLDHRVGQLLVCYTRFVHPWYLLLRAVVSGHSVDELLATDLTENDAYPADYEPQEERSDEDEEQDGEDDDDSSIWPPEEGDNDDNDGPAAEAALRDRVDTVEADASRGNESFHLPYCSFFFEHNDEPPDPQLLRDVLRDHTLGAGDARQAMKFILNQQIAPSSFRERQMYKHDMHHTMANHSRRVACKYYGRSPFLLPGQISSERVEGLTLCETLAHWMFNVTGYNWDSELTPRVSGHTVVTTSAPQVPTIQQLTAQEARQQEQQEAARHVLSSIVADPENYDEELAIGTIYADQAHHDVHYRDNGSLRQELCRLLQRLIFVPVVVLSSNPVELQRLQQLLDQANSRYSSEFVVTGNRFYCFGLHEFTEDPDFAFKFLADVAAAEARGHVLVVVADAARLLEEDEKDIQALAEIPQASFLLCTSYMEDHEAKQLAHLFDCRRFQELANNTMRDQRASYHAVSSVTDLTPLLSARYVGVATNDRIRNVVVIWGGRVEDLEITAQLPYLFQLLVPNPDLAVELEVMRLLAERHAQIPFVLVLSRAITNPIVPDVGMVVVCTTTSLSEIVRAASMLSASVPDSRGLVVFVPHGLASPHRTDLSPGALSMTRFINSTNRGTCYRQFLQMATGKTSSWRDVCGACKATPCGNCLR